MIGLKEVPEESGIQGSSAVWMMLVPLVEWRRHVTTALQQLPPGYGDPTGLPNFRRALAVWIGRSRSVMTVPDNVIVTAGAQQGFELIGRTVFARGDVVVVEDPGYALARHAFASLGLRVVGVPVDDEGIDVSRIPERARGVYVTPSHQAPTGVTMSAARRRQLLLLAAARDIAVIEDDYDTEFRHVDRPLEPLHRLDPAGRVIYVGSFSKSLSPSLRLGFLVVPESLREAILSTRRVVDTQPPHLVQAAMATFLREGFFDRHLRRTRRIYSERHAVVMVGVRDLERRGLIEPVYSSNAGLHVTVSLHENCDAANVVARMRQRGVVMETTEDSWMDTPKPGLVIGFGLATGDQLNDALTYLRKELTSARGK